MRATEPGGPGTTKQTKVEVLQSQIDDCKRRIAQLKSEIDDKYAWARRQPWYKRAASMAQATAFAAKNGPQITELYVKISTLESAKLMALASSRR